MKHLPPTTVHYTFCRTESRSRQLYVLTSPKDLSQQFNLLSLSMLCNIAIEQDLVVFTLHTVAYCTSHPGVARRPRSNQVANLLDLDLQHVLQVVAFLL